MTKTTALIAATAASLIATAAPAAAQSRAFDAITLTQQADADRYCIRSGWGIAGTYANRLIRRGDCHDQKGWSQRGVAIDPVYVQVAARAKSVQVASR
ncbi:hypothetical protein [uncultured Sphingomonas sp.]|uniref:hypothetical protein n=1 Tax=uncultured Sphingomonas sp. TaxID=158754 RepID=UPI0025D4F467|nr:hypothetical protein [uncultured Sphingomonas sp.]